MGQLFTGSVAIRGIRGPIPSGYMLGRLDSGSGPPQLVSMKSLGSKMVQSGIPVTRLSALQDVAFSTLSDKNHIQYNLTAGKWVNVAAPALSNLTDVDTTGVLNTNLLRFNSGTSKWVPWVFTYTLIGASDVSVSSPANNDVLTWNTAAGKWINAAPTGGGGGGGTAFVWAKITANTAAVASHGYFCDTSGGPFTLTLPATPSIGDSISVEDATGSFATNNLTIARNGNPIGGVAADMTVNTKRAYFGLVFSDAILGWQVADVAAGSSGSSTLAGDTDVVLTSPANNDVLTFDIASGKWINKPASAGATTLAADTDVAIAAPAAGDMLRYNAVSGKWENFVNKIWSWPCPSLGSTQNTATASKGSPIYLTRAIIVDKIAIAINATSGIVYSGYIATITAGSGNSATITGLVAATARITAAASKYQTLEFDLAPTTLAANTMYMLCGVGTTLATSGTNLPFGVSSGGTYPELPLDNAFIVNQWNLIGTGCAIFALPTLSDNPVGLVSSGASSNNLYIGLRWRYA